MGSDFRRDIRVEELIRTGVLALNDGYRVRNIELGPTGIPFVRGGDIGGGGINTDVTDHILPEYARRVQSKLSQPWDVAFITKGTVGRVGILRPDQPQSVFAPQICYWRSLDHQRLEPRFLFYLLRSSAFQSNLDAVKTHGSMAADYVSLSDQRAFLITVPEIEQQRAIVSMLGTIDDRIDLLRQTNTTLETIAQALFKAWFVDFDPVRAKAEGREPEAMDAATAALFPSEFEDSELGPIPKGWRLTRVGEVADLVKGCSYKGAGLSDADGAYMFNLGCFNAKRIFATEKIKRYTGTYRERHAVTEGDLIVANTDMTQHREILGRPLFVPGGCEPGFISHHVFKVAPVLPNAAQWKQFLFFAFQQPEFRERAVGYATGTTVLALARDSAEKCPIVDPGKALLSSFSELATPLLSQIANNLQREKSLEQLRDTLLPRLISGKLRLPDAARTDEEAVA